MADFRTSWPASFRDATELPPEEVGALIEALIAELDGRQPDPDLEPNGDELDGINSEDDFWPHWQSGMAAGCPVSDPGGDTLDEHGEETFISRIPPKYGDDQSKGPTNRPY